MIFTRRWLRLAGPLVLLTGLVAPGAIATAQSTAGTPTLQRTPLQQTDFPDADHTSILMQIDVPPNFTVARHVHPGVEIGYILTGTATMSIDGQPDRIVGPGDSFLAGAGVPHVIRTGAEPMRVISVYVVAKNKPLATPAPN